MRVFTVLIGLMISLVAVGQELNCQVSVIAPTDGVTDKRVYDAMQTSIFEFMNNRRWTNDVFKPEERIECSILININERVSANEFKGSIQITARRPVYNSSYYSDLFNYSDNDFHINYLENSRIEFTPDQHRSNLASILAFYAYMILGYDYDSFALEGGSQYFGKAQGVVNNAQNARESGWKAFEGTKNRYWLVDNAMHKLFKPMRECFYKYHRLGFDKMYDDIDAGRKAVADGLELLRQVHRNRPGSFNMQVFFVTKSNEIVNLFSGAYPDEKSKIFNLLKEIDPTNTSRYQKIMNNN